LLASRGGRVARDGQGLDAQLQSLGVAARSVACDSAVSRDTHALLCAHRVDGVLHAAGVLRDGMLRFMGADDVATVFAPKAVAASHIQQAAAHQTLEAVGLFSSIAATLGNMGQANYAAANAHLDALCVSRRRRGLFGSSLQIPTVSGAGMGACTFTEEQLVAMGAISLSDFAGFLSISIAPVHAAFERTQTLLALESLAGTSLPAISELVTSADSEASLCTSAPAQSSGSELGSRLSALGPTQRRAHVEDAILRVVRELTGTPATSITSETPLMEAGVDSLAATELSSRLQILTGVSLSSTLVFEQPTSRAVAAHLLEQVGGAAEAPRMMPAPAAAGPGDATSSQLSIVGMVGRWPGGCDGELTRWELQAASGDALGSVPAARWVLKEQVDVRQLSAAQIESVQHGGFVRDAQRFDAPVFGISSAETAAMDPQQRLLLELGYMALHAASHRRVTLMGGDGAVSLGIERPDWAIAQPPLARGSVYAVTGDNVSAAAGRVSFVLGLQGSCSSVDTACSSALAATHAGMHVVSERESSAALSLATGLKLTPLGTLAQAASGMVSTDGRCKTFDKRANGYVRSEAAGALVLLPDPQVGSCELCSSVVRQDGRSASLTAPNGSAQRKLLLVALARATLGPTDLGTVEAHGTGTALGDPTEAGSLAAVLGSVERSMSLVVSNAKGSVGHSEAASGQVLLRRALQVVVEGSAAAGNAQLRALNPMVDEQMSSARAANLVLPSQEMFALRQVAGVSSFGYSGTIAHVVMASGRTDVEAHAALKHMRGSHVPTLTFRRRGFAWQDQSASMKLTLAGTELTADTPLMQAGVNSLAAIKLSSRLRADTGISTLSPTLMFEHPTSRAIGAHIEQLDSTCPVSSPDEILKVVHDMLASIGTGTMPPDAADLPEEMGQFEGNDPEEPNLSTEVGNGFQARYTFDPFCVAPSKWSEMCLRIPQIAAHHGGIVLESALDQGRVIVSVSTPQAAAVTAQLHYLVQSSLQAPGQQALPMSETMLRDHKLGAFHISQTYDLEADDDMQLVARALDQLVSIHPMLRTVHTPPVFSICERAEYVLDEEELPRRDKALCHMLVKEPIDLTVGVFRARLNRVGGCSAFLTLSFHHLVMDGPSQQVVYGHLSRILAANRVGKACAISAHAATRIARSTIRRHIRTLNAVETELPQGVCHVALPFEVDGRFDDACIQSSWNIPLERMLDVETEAQRQGLTLNALLLGSLAWRMHECSGQQQFAIGQTYLARGMHELQTVGSFSTCTPLLFDFTTSVSLRATCEHVLRETQRVMSQDTIIQGTQDIMVLWELNDLRPIPRPTSQTRRVHIPLKIVDLFVVVNQYIDGFEAVVTYQAGRFDDDALEDFVSAWWDGLHVCEAGLS
jgi:3-oxoacyl-(acyl-carrier-protein) synthase/acyl carrier protein